MWFFAFTPSFGQMNGQKCASTHVDDEVTERNTYFNVTYTFKMFDQFYIHA